MKSALGSPRWNYMFDSEGNPIPPASDFPGAIPCRETKSVTPNSIGILEFHQQVAGARETALASASDFQLRVLELMSESYWIDKEERYTQAQAQDLYLRVDETGMPKYWYVKTTGSGMVVIGSKFQVKRTYPEAAEALGTSVMEVFRAVVELRRLGLL